MRRITFMAAAVLFATLPALSQDKPATVHGHVQDPLGLPVANATIILSDEPSMQNPRYTFTSDAEGNYKGADIKAGTYVFSLRKGEMAKDKVLDQIVEVKVAAGVDVTQDFDMTRAAYISKMSPEEKKQVEETRKKNEEVLKENAGIKNLNTNLLKARADNTKAHLGPCVDTAGKPVAGHADPAKCTADGFQPNVAATDYAEAETLMQQSTAVKPDSAILWLELGNAQLGLKKYSDAETSLKKAVDLDVAAKKPNPEIQGTAYNSLGEVYASQAKLPDASAAYESAVKANPTAAGMYYSNQAVIYTRVNQLDAAVAAADKAIAAEPTRAVPYYLKGQALMNKAAFDPKSGKLVTPPGCVEAYQKYLALAPTGQFAPEVKQLLDSLPGTLKPSYKASKK